MLRIADELRVPVTARGTGTGLSGAASPATDGDRRVVRADERDPRDRHRQPRRRGAARRHPRRSSTRRPRAHGLVYPVFPGENSASLGGNVATNAGGMRAVKYGVTRHQVLGLEAVLATGEVIRTGGKFVKATTGYDLTQLIIGSEGTLALVTEATLRLYPRPRTTATVLAPFATLDEVTAAVPRIVDSRHRPADPRVHRHAHDGGDQPRHRASSSASPRTIKDTALAYLVVVLENRTPTGSTRTSDALAELLAELGALDVYVLPAGAGAGADRRPREGVLDGQGDRRRRHHRHGRAAGVDPRRSWRRCAALAPSTTARWSPAAATPATATCTCRSSSPTPTRRSRAARGALRQPGMALGGAISGEHGIGTAKKRVLPRARGPRQARPDAPHQDRVRPGRHPQPRRHLRLTTARRRHALDHGDHPMNGAQALIRTLVDAGVDVCFTNPGTSEMHFVAALDDVPEMRGVLALFEGVATGAADGYARMADKPGRDAAAPRPRARQRPRQPAQRPHGPHADRQHRRRPRDVPQAVRRPAASPTSRAVAAQRVGVDPLVGRSRRGRRRRRRRRRRRARARPARSPR